MYNLPKGLPETVVISYREYIDRISKLEERSRGKIISSAGIVIWQEEEEVYIQRLKHAGFSEMEIASFYNDY